MPSRNIRTTQTNKRNNRIKSKKKSFLKRRFLKIPIWIWLIVLVIGIANSSGDNTATTPVSTSAPAVETIASVDSTPIASVTISTIETTTIPTIEPTAAPIITATVEPTNTPVPTNDPTQYVIKQGDKNDDVKALQRALISLGYLSGSADGDFGSKTANAVKAYQKAAGLPITGTCDYDTYLSITSPYAPAAPTAVPTEEPDEDMYVYNKNTKKFHYPECSSADDIKPKNRGEFVGTREQMIKKGYVPCKHCNP